MKILVFLSVLTLLPIYTTCFAESEDNIQYRQHIMEGLSSNLKASSMILKGKIKTDISGHTASILDSATRLSELFPEGSDFGDTEAKAEIWEQEEKFKTELNKFKKAAIDFNKSPSMNTLSAIGKSCKSCHKAFREK